MRLSRNRNWGHPQPDRLPRAAVEAGAADQRLAGPPRRRHRAAARRTDDHRPRLAPDRPRCRRVADPDARPPAQRAPSARRCRRPNMVRPDRLDIDPNVWTPAAHSRSCAPYRRSPRWRAFSSTRRSRRRSAARPGGDRAWLTKIRPMFGHNYHFHIRLACPTGEEGCADQDPPPRATAAAPSSTSGSRRRCCTRSPARRARP